jgi:hypothetical protein
MSIWQGGRGNGGYGGGYGGGRQQGSGGPSESQLQDLVDKFSAQATLIASENKLQGKTRLSSKLNVGGAEYDLKVNSDGTFKATKSDGSIELKLYHDTSTWGSPLTFSYRNDRNPNQSGETKSSSVCDRAEVMARAWFVEATKEDSLDF